ncbi:hypothetical protein FA702_05770 [Novosphingobium sp. EMRT-2]|nr:hypothetical protein FA702_05770 [Novosphingobium sp. EMRT-2]
MHINLLPLLLHCNQPRAENEVYHHGAVKFVYISFVVRANSFRQTWPHEVPRAVICLAHAAAGRSKCRKKIMLRNPSYGNSRWRSKGIRGK